MMGMFESDWGTLYALSTIDRIYEGQKTQDGRRTYRVMRRGEEDGDGISSFTYDRIISHPLQLIPAAPGIDALLVSVGEGDPSVIRTPVIAWARCFDGSIRVVTPAGVDDGHIWKEGEGYVQMPDGSVHAVGEYSSISRFDDLDAYVAYEVEQHRERVDQPEGSQAC